MNSLWNEYFVSPWDNWTVCEFKDVPLSTPSNQCQEAWHRQLASSRIPGIFKASTETLLKEALPKLATMDGVMIPTQLCFQVCSTPSVRNTGIPRAIRPEYRYSACSPPGIHCIACYSVCIGSQVPVIPTAMVQKAMRYVENRRKWVKAAKDTETGELYFYVLSQSQTKYTAINDTLTSRVDAALRGEMPRGIKAIDSLISVCEACHIIDYIEEGKPHIPIPGVVNCRLRCSCKGFAHIAVCSHVLAIAHIIQKTDLGNSLRRLCAPRKGGYTKGCLPALQKEKVPESPGPDERVPERPHIQH